MQRTHFVFGQEIPANALAPDFLDEILTQAEQAKLRLRDYPASEILLTLERVGKLWANPDYPGRREALEKLPNLIGFSREMVERGIEYLSLALTRETLEADLKLQLGTPERLDRFCYDRQYQGLIKAQPHGILLHVSAGNVFVGAVLHIAHGLLTKNVNIVKLSSQDPLFPILFARSLAACDPQGILVQSLAMLHWKGGDVQIENILKQGCNAISVFGGEEAVASYRKGLPPHVTLLEHGPKVGVALIGREALTGDLQELSRRLVHDAVMWDQNACSSPQLVYIEGDANLLVEPLAEAFREKARELPIGDLDDDERVEITKLREMAKIEEVREISSAHYDAGSIDWTVVVRNSTEFETSPLNRTLILKSVPDLQDAIEVLRPYRYYLQSVGLELPVGRLESYANRLAEQGGTRITQVGRMSSGKLGSPHDGGYPLQELIQWASLEREFEGYTPLDYMPNAERDPLLLAKLRDLVSYVRARSPFYARHWGDQEVNSLEDFSKLPPVERAVAAQFLPPNNTEALTGPIKGTYLFSSGGTMGKPRVFTYTGPELHESTEIWGRGFRMAGVTSDDVVANLFMPGYLWSGFIVANDALEGIGATILPIGVASDREKIADLLVDLNATCMIGIPTQLLAIAREFEKRGHCPNIKKIGYAGEHLSEGTRRFLKETLGAEKIFSVGYAAVDTGPIAYACECAEGTIHHVPSDYCYVEIVDKKTKRPVKDGEIGELLVTNFSRRLTPVVRYAVGDLARKVGGTCPCGRTSPRFELMGRSDDILIVSGTNYSQEFLEKLVTLDSRLSENFQMVASNPNQVETLTFRLELNRTVPETEKNELREKLWQAAQKNEELSHDLQAGLLDFELEIVEPGALPSVGRTQKTKRTVDLRN